MNKLKFFSVAFFAAFSLANAQDVDQARKAIDAEQFEKAKKILKAVLQAKPSNGTASFLLGNVYTYQKEVDSAKIYYQKGIAGSDGAKLNYIGLGQLDLDGNNPTAAQSNFDIAIKDAKRKDATVPTYIARAYMNISKPDFKNAIAILEKAKIDSPQNAELLLALGDAYYLENKQNEAYSAYRSAFQIDPTMLRAKMQLGVLLKGAKSYDLAINAFNEVIAINPNYGPVYRELAETYYKWGRNKPSKSAENMQLAISNYDKYMSLTDYSLASRMRRADFLVLLKNWTELEKEANKMIELDKVNPRIFRYLAYSAFENGNVDVALKSLESFITNPNSKIIAKDYIYLAEIKFKKAIAADGLTIDQTMYASGLIDLKKALELEPLATEDLNDIGKKLFSKKFYKEAASIFELGTKNTEDKNYVDDNIYYALSIFYANSKKDVKADVNELKNADAALDKVVTAAPTYQDAFLYKARINRLAENEDLIIKYYEAYIAKLTEKGELANTNHKTKVIESYNNLAASYADKDKAKAVEYFNKTLAIDPTNDYATKSLATLK
ncbi:tetratricopeptide repeat protein [Flavobacterium succinicans]|uniref:Lipopolysaccharide regulatory protein n=1 Tax=Flavobacterium succinicans TaxID=29536 RepID=A0A199XU28_9FLAO|nr:tetratricopeptide repeat protein [Flavobacterium succinicans]OAZ05268.1 lipopolysaccharide regulatory protein [Flavobacterium succinicans]